MRNLHLICNAHVDPAWLWEMEEGVSTALSTFCMAATFCEEYEGLVFNHNEVLLYEWIEEQEPTLFERIRKLVKVGRWHIMGGWYLQPDCNMPGGESLIRQMEMGRNYFREKFDVTPTTAINFDSFGHSRGLVQLMAKAGYDSYLFCRPGQGDCPLPEDDFIWVGFDGSKVAAHRADTYGTMMGEAGKTVRKWMDGPGQKESLQTGCVLWGVGNHGGGPSRVDLDEIGRMMEGDQTWKLLHSTPESYFGERSRLCREQGIQEPVVEKDLNSWSVGCYTSQIRIKQKHWELEGELAVTEKMLSQAVVLGLLTYPEDDLKEAQKALLFCEFHDILPGTSIRPVEERALQTLGYGLELTKKWKRRAFFALQSGESGAKEGEYPILIYNPHPYAVECDFTCEFQLANQNWTEQYALPVIIQGGEELPSQVEKENCNMNLDWRKRVTFHGTLKPTSMNRFSAKIRMVEQRPIQRGGATVSEELIVFENGQLYVAVNRRTGLMDVYQVNGKDYLQAGGCALAVMKSDCDPWGMNRHSYREEEGFFTLMDQKEGSRYSGTVNERHAGMGTVIESVRIIEEGPVRTVVEAVFSYGHSQACVRYILPARGTAVTVQVCVNWAEKGKFLKFEVPTCMEDSVPYSETAYGVMKQQADGEEKVFHRWCGLWNLKDDRALTVINKGNYGVDFRDGVMRISLIHSAVYSAHPIGDRPLLVQDRLLPYIDQGEREFSFVIQAGKGIERMEHVTNEAVLFQEMPMAVQSFPSGEGEKAESVICVDDPAVILSAWRKIDGQDAYMIRLFESTGKARKVKLSLPGRSYEQELLLKPFEVRTLRFVPGEVPLTECGILGE